MLSFLEEIKFNKLSESLLLSISKLEPDFDKITNLLQNKIFLKENKDFLSIIGINLNQYELRMFLSIFMIKYCPNEIFQEKKELEENLIINSSNLVEDYLNILKKISNYTDFPEKIKNFLNIFQIWKEQDKKKFMFILSSTYNELNMTKKQIENTQYNSEDEKERARIWLLEIEKQKKSLEKSVYQIGGESGIEKMIDGTFWLDVINPEFRILIENNLKKSFRTKLIDEINSEKIPYTLISSLKEILNNLQKNNPIIDKKVKIELLNMNLSIVDRYNLVKGIVELFMKEYELEEKLENVENIVDNLLIVYDKIGK